MRSPTQFCNWPDHKAASLWRENRPQLGQNLRCRRNRIGGEQQLPHHVAFQPIGQRQTVKRAFNRQNAANAIKRKPIAQFDLWCKPHPNDDHQTEWFCANQPNRCDADLGDFQLEHTAIFLLNFVIAQIATAIDHPGFDAHPGPRGYLGRDLRIATIHPTDRNAAAFDHHCKHVAQLARQREHHINAVVCICVIGGGLFDCKLAQF